MLRLGGKAERAESAVPSHEGGYALRREGIEVVRIIATGKEVHV